MYFEVRSRRLCNTREYVAICFKAKRGGKNVRHRKESFTRNTTQLVNDRCSKCNATRMMMDSRRYFSRTSAFGNFDRNRFWPLYLLSLLGAPIYISEQYFRSDANCKEIFFSTQRQKRLVAFEHDNSLKTSI